MGSVSQTILVVDDDEIIRRVIRTSLSLAGYIVLDAKDGEEGLEVFQQHQFGVALTDVLMPRMDGQQLADAVLALRPQLPVLFISGNTQNCNRGFGCVAKPFTPQALLKRISEVLDASQPTQTSATDGG